MKGIVMNFKNTKSIAEQFSYKQLKELLMFFHFFNI